MSDIEFNNEYWEQALNVLQVEENWLDAQAVLRRAERKEFVFRLMPYAVLFLLVSSLGLWLWTSQTSDAQMLKLRNITERTIAFKKVNNTAHFTKKHDESQSNIASIEKDQHFETAKVNQVTNSIPVQKNSLKTISINKSRSSKKMKSAKFVSNEQSLSFAEKNKHSVLSKTNDDSWNKVIHIKINGNNPTVLTSQGNVDSQQSLLDRKNNQREYQPLDNTVNLNLSKISYRNYFNQTSSVRPIFVNNSHSVQRNLKPQLNGLSFVFGTSQYVGFGSDNHGRINPEFGLEYQRYLSKNTSLTSGITYFNIEGLNHQVEFSDVQVGFNKTETKYSFSSNKVHYLFVPLQLTWTLNRFHSISLGAAVSYFLSNNGQVELLTFENEIQQSRSIERTRGYTSGYRPFIASLLGGYELALNYKTSLGFQYQFGLNTIVNDEVYSPDNRDKNSRLRILIKRRIR